MAMNGIDIASYQAGIDLSVVPTDFAIVKATQGTNYTNPDCVRAVEQCLSLGKPFGVYHYISGGNAQAEAKFFVDSVANWVGKGILCLDWESEQNSAWGNESYLADVVSAVVRRTGIPPMIYVQQSRMSAVKSIADTYNCGLWIAQYASMNPTGYQDTPWNEGAYACAIRQYSSSGTLDGYSGRLDLDKFYGDAAAWARYANPAGSSVTPEEIKPTVVTPSGTTLELAVAVMQGKYGSGDARRNGLGTRYDEIQNFINHIFSASTDTLANEVIAGTYGSGETRKTVLSSRYDEVQKAVNAKLNQKSIDTIAREVIAGKWGNDPLRTRKLKAAGYDAAAVQKRVNELL